MKIPLCRAHTGREEAEAVKEILTSELPWLAHGPKNKELEEGFVELIGSKYALSVNSCASALFLVLKGYDIKGEVISPSFTFSASANAIVLAGAKPVFADVDERTYNLDPGKMEELIGDKTEAIMPVHFGGQCCDMEKIMKIAEERGLKVIEDSAETIGGTFKDKWGGSFGVGCFSFFPVKNMTTGEGGLITSKDGEFIERAKKLCAHGIVKDQDLKWARSAVLPGYNFRMSNINAAIGVEQFKKLEEMNEKRRENADYLNKKLQGLVEVPFEDPKCKHVYQMYVIKVPEGVDRNKLVAFLNEKGIEASVHFDPPVHLQDYYKGKFKCGDLSVTEKVCKRIVTLPMFPSLKKEEMDYMVGAVEEGLKQ